MKNWIFTLLSLAFTFTYSASIAEQNRSDNQQWMVLNYWSVNCAPCRIEIPELNKLFKELKAENIRLVGINFDEDTRERTVMLAEKMGIEFPTLKQEQVNALRVSSPHVLPTTVILSPNGIEKGRLIGAKTKDSIKAMLGQLIGVTQ